MGEAVMLAQTTKNKIDYFDHGSIRKAVLVSRYVQILREWILKNNKRKKSKSKQNNSEQQQLNVFVSEEFEDKFQSFATYFKREAMLIADDKTLNKEISVLRSLYNNKQKICNQIAQSGHRTFPCLSVKLTFVL